VLRADQLRGLGFSAREIEGGAGRGELTRVHRGVYLLGSIPLPLSAEAAALLACGHGAVLSHRSAAVLLGLLSERPRRPHVTVPGSHRRGDKGITVHRDSLAHWEIRERHDLPVTSPVRTLIDLAATEPPDELERAVAESFAIRLTNLPSLPRALERYRGRRGVARLSALLEHGGPRRTRSGPERTLLAAIRDAGLPIPETNVRLGRWEVDFLWRAEKLAVEVDAYSTHSSPFAFERDRRKDAELRAMGLVVQRFTGERVRDELAAVLSWIGTALALAAS
jgi:very-short-patch-repair endonuclease